MSDEPVDTDRIGRLREVTQRRWTQTQLGPIEAELLRVVCDRCGRVKKLTMDRFGLDWPEQLEGWATVEGEGDLCPTCRDEWREGR